MKTSIALLIAAGVSAMQISCAANAVSPVSQDTIAAALADPRRPAEQMRLDANRKPALILAFAKMHRGGKILDFMPGNAYFTRAFSDIVGNTGRVIAFIPAEEVAHCSPEEIAGTEAVGRDPSYANVTVVTAPLEQFSIAQPLDMIFTAQNYHDLHDLFMGPADVAALNQRFFAALKPGGILLVIDHVAETGSGLRDTETLHRIDPVTLETEIEAAGFVLESHDEALRNPTDDHQRAVFDPVIRGQTDQVIYRFRKPSPTRR